MPVTPTGFVADTLDDVKAELEAAERASFGAGINTSSASVLGEFNGIFGDKIAEINEVLEDLANSADPETATGAALDAICALTGVTRLPATYSKVTLTVNLNAGVTLAIGRVVSAVGNPSVKFQTVAAVTNSGGAPANFPVEAWATVTGPVFAAAAALTVIESPQTGWNSVTNALDTTVEFPIGANIESDPDLRARRQATLQAAGSANAQAIRADLLAVTNVTQAAVFENSSEVTDPDGVPPHAFESVVQGGTDANIAQAIWDSKPIGIATHGSVTQNVTDYAGVLQPVKFSRPTTVPIYITVTLTKTAASYAGDAAVKAALVLYLSNFLLGQDLIRSQIFGQVTPIAGVVDITALTLGTAPSPAGTANIVATSRQLLTTITANIVVNSSDA